MLIQGGNLPESILYDKSLQRQVVDILKRPMHTTYELNKTQSFMFDRVGDTNARRIKKKGRRQLTW
jgi:hypothetical protein